MALERFLFSGPDGYYKKADPALQSTTGVSDAGKLIQTDANGLLDPSFLPSSVINGYDWKESVRVASKTNINLAAPGATIDGVTMANGERFLAAGQTAGEENHIYVFNGAAVPATRAPDADSNEEVTSGNRVYISEGTCAEQVATLIINDPIVLDTTSLSYGFQSIESLTDGDGIDITGGVVSVDLSADSGLEFVGGELQIDFADTSVAGDLDSTNGMLVIKAADLSSNGANQGANILGFDPSNCSTITATNIQGAVDEVCAAVESVTPGVETVDGVGVTAGDLVYYSANDTISTHDTLTDTEEALGLASTTAGAGGTTAVARDGEILTGVLAGATAGDKYYWDGSTYTTNLSSFSPGEHVWQVGVAKNATDLRVDVEFIHTEC